MTNDGAVNGWWHYDRLWAETMNDRSILINGGVRLYLCLNPDGISVELHTESVKRADIDWWSAVSSVITTVSGHMQHLDAYEFKRIYNGLEAMYWLVPGWELPAELRDREGGASW